MEASFKRLFESTDANSEDFYFGYRPFMVSTGWTIETYTSAPQVMQFTRQVVDFG